MPAAGRGGLDLLASRFFSLQDLFCTGLALSDFIVRGWWVQGEGRPPFQLCGGLTGAPG